MARFKPLSSGARRDCSANFSTTPVFIFSFLPFRKGLNLEFCSNKLFGNEIGVELPSHYCFWYTRVIIKCSSKFIN